MGELDGGEGDHLCPSAAGRTAGEQPQEEGGFLQVCVGVVDDLGQEVVDTDEGTDVLAEEVELLGFGRAWRLGDCGANDGSPVGRCGLPLPDREAPALNASSWFSSRRRRYDEPADRLFGRQVAGSGEGVQAVVRELVRRTSFRRSPAATPSVHRSANRLRSCCSAWATCSPRCRSAPGSPQLAAHPNSEEPPICGIAHAGDWEEHANGGYRRMAGPAERRGELLRVRPLVGGSSEPPDQCHSSGSRARFGAGRRAIHHEENTTDRCPRPSVGSPPCFFQRPPRRRGPSSSHC
jgi:hypothetical protein